MIYLFDQQLQYLQNEYYLEDMVGDTEKISRIADVCAP